MIKAGLLLVWLINIAREARPAELQSFIVNSFFMRQSVAPNRISQTSHPSSTVLARLLEKKKEFSAVSALEKASALYLERIEGLSEDCDIMANAGEGWSDFENGS